MTFFAFSQEAEKEDVSDFGNSQTQEGNSPSNAESLIAIAEEGEGISAQSSFGGVWLFLRMILVLALIIVAIYFLFKFLKKGLSPQELQEDSPFLRKVSAVSVGVGKSVQVVTLLDKAYLIGICENSVNLIDKIEDKEFINAMNLYADRTQNVEKPKSFGEILEIFMPSSKSKKVKSAYDAKSTEEIIQSLKNRKFSSPMEGEK